MAESLTSFPFWTIATALFIAQLTGLVWRIRREVEMESLCERIWITASDYFVILSMVILIGGVFIAPIFGSSLKYVVIALIFSIFFLAFAPIILIGHYRLLPFWRERGPRSLVTNQEKFILFMASILFLVLLSVVVCAEMGCVGGLRTVSL
jgi:heme O synthase-like polyprenyltransferase